MFIQQILKLNFSILKSSQVKKKYKNVFSPDKYKYEYIISFNENNDDLRC